jgi:hypothetical protein
VSGPAVTAHAPEGPPRPTACGPGVARLQLGTGQGGRTERLERSSPLIRSPGSPSTGVQGCSLARRSVARRCWRRPGGGSGCRHGCRQTTWKSQLGRTLRATSTCATGRNLQIRGHLNGRMGTNGVQGGMSDGCWIAPVWPPCPVPRATHDFQSGPTCPRTSQVVHRPQVRCRPNPRSGTPTSSALASRWGST